MAIVYLFMFELFKMLEQIVYKHLSMTIYL
jgi:hypothetical protein